MACGILDRTGIGIKERTNLRMQAATRQAADVSVVDITGRITLGEGNVMLRDIVQGLIEKGNTKIALNLAGVDHIDSAGIGELVRSHTTVRKAGGQLKLAAPNKKVHDMLKMTRLSSVFDVQPDEASAIQSFGKPTAAKT